jgi:NlpC/P60 family putative phage cell wall peptidase
MTLQHDRAAVVAAARDWLGTPYHHQASRRLIGCDCLGLVRGIWRDLYGGEPETMVGYSRDWTEVRPDDPLLAAAARHLRRADGIGIAAGDVLLFRYRPSAAVKHLAVATGPQAMIHAVERSTVREVEFTPWWRRRLSAVYLFPGTIT